MKITKNQLINIMTTQGSKKAYVYRTLLTLRNIGDSIAVDTDHVTSADWRTYIQHFQRDVGGHFSTKKKVHEYRITHTIPKLPVKSDTDMFDEIPATFVTPEEVKRLDQWIGDTSLTKPSKIQLNKE